MLLTLDIFLITMIRSKIKIVRGKTHFLQNTILVFKV